MVPKLNDKPKIRALKTGESLGLLPAMGHAWEVWLFSSGRPSELLETISDDASPPRTKSTVMGLPVRYVHSVPVWLNGADKATFSSALDLQLELLGVTGRGKIASTTAWSSIVSEASRSLLSVGVLNRQLPSGWIESHYLNYDLCVRFYPMRKDFLTLWMEQGRLAVAFTQGAEVAYFQDLVAGELTAQVVQDLVCIRSALDLRGVLPPLRGIALWFTPTEQARLLLEKRFKIKPLVENKPAPVLPTQAWTLTPVTVTVAKQAVSRSASVRRLLALAALLYLVAAAALFGRLAYSHYQLQQVQAWMAAHEGDLESVRKTQSAWTELQQVTDQDHYPLENLVHCATAIPSDDFHLTTFQQDKGNLALEGEAKSGQTTVIFKERLEQDPHFKDFTWTVGPPNFITPEQSQIRVEGKYAPSN